MCIARLFSNLFSLFRDVLSPEVRDLLWDTATSGFAYTMHISSVFAKVTHIFITQGYEEFLEYWEVLREEDKPDILISKKFKT